MEYADDRSYWYNDILYQMCAVRPEHVNVDVVRSKLLIIGRVYSAAIERKAGKFNYEDAAARIINSEIDKEINSISSIERIDFDNIEYVLRAHKYVTDLFKDLTGLEKRSLASKYLHFHAPRSVFIFDSKANAKIKSELKKMSKKFKKFKNYDREYAIFVQRCIQYRNEILEVKLGQLATPRRVDMELMRQE